MSTLKELPKGDLQASLSQREITIVKDGEGLFIVDSATGEILEQALHMIDTQEPPQGPINTVSKYVGIDTRFPSQARDTVELLEATEVHDPFLKNLTVDYQSLFGLLDQGIPQTEVMVFRYLCENLTAWNVWIGNMEQLALAFPKLSQRSLFAILKSLEKGLIWRTNKGARGDMLIRVHPWYAFRGASYIREELLARWILARNKAK